MFSSKESLVTFCIGAGGLLLGILMAVTGAVCLRTGTGAPEYIICLRNAGLTFIALSALWLALAIAKELNRK